MPTPEFVVPVTMRIVASQFGICEAASYRSEPGGARRVSPAVARRTGIPVGTPAVGYLLLVPAAPGIACSCTRQQPVIRSRRALQRDGAARQDHGDSPSAVRATDKPTCRRTRRSRAHCPGKVGSVVEPRSIPAPKIGPRRRLQPRLEPWTVRVCRRPNCLTRPRFGNRRRPLVTL